MISVALCTYNGASYIKEQIESILNQTVPVDEIVVCDDGSTDVTIEIIMEFQKEPVRTNIRLYKNERPIGVYGNFQKAVDLCVGDIVFLADQDDIWHLKKVETIVDWFNCHPSCQVVFSDAILVDAQGSALKTDKNTLFKNTYSHTEQKLFESGNQLESFLLENHATGATMAIRKSFFERHSFADKCNGEILHDYVIALQAIQENCLGIIYSPLISYRIHSQQTCGLSREITTAKKQWYKLYLLQSSIYPLLTTTDAQEAADYIIFRTRETCRFLGIFRLIGHWGNYYSHYHRLAINLFLLDLKDWCTIQLHRFDR